MYLNIVHTNEYFSEKNVNQILFIFNMRNRCNYLPLFRTMGGAVSWKCSETEREN